MTTSKQGVWKNFIEWTKETGKSQIRATIVLSLCLTLFGKLFCYKFMYIPIVTSEKPLTFGQNWKLVFLVIQMIGRWLKTCEVSFCRLAKYHFFGKNAAASALENHAWMTAMIGPEAENFSSLKDPYSHHFPNFANFWRWQYSQLKLMHCHGYSPSRNSSNTVEYASRQFWAKKRRDWFFDRADWRFSYLSVQRVLLGNISLIIVPCITYLCYAIQDTSISTYC